MRDLGVKRVIYSDNPTIYGPGNTLCKECGRSTFYSELCGPCGLAKQVAETKQSISERPEWMKKLSIFEGERKE
jgi:hypothetical protein